MSAPRIAPGSRRQLGPVNAVIVGVIGLATKTRSPHLFATLGRNRGLFRGWLHFAGQLMPGGKLPRRETELVILRVAHLRACSYERDHHVRLGRKAGLSDAEIARTAQDDAAAAAEWSPRERTLLAATDELHASGDLTDASWAALREHLDERLALEFVMLVAHYEMLATTLITLRVQPDRHR